MDVLLETHSRKIPGHNCTLEERFIEEEILYGDTFLSRPQRFMRFWQRSFLVSRKHPYTKYIFKSVTSFNREVTRHVYINVNIIHPYSYFRSIWEIFMVFVYVTTLLYVPFFVFIVFLDIEKRKQYPFAIWDDVHFVIFGITLIDIFVNLHSGYVLSKTKEIVLDRNRISRHYIFTYLFVDIISAFPLEYLMVVILRRPWENCYWLRYLQLLRLLRIGTLQTYARQMLTKFEAGLGATKSIIATMMIIISIHWMSCIYPLHFLTSIADEKSDRIRTNSDVAFSHYILGKNLTWIYIWELKLTLALSNMFGCNLQYTQRTVKDFLLRILVSLCGILLMIYIAVQAVLIIKIIRCTATKYEEMYLGLKEFIKQKNIPGTLEKRLIDYFKFSYSKNYLWEPFAQDFISSQLQQEVMIHNCKALLEKTPVFKGLEEECVNKLVSFLTHTIVLANDVITKSGTSTDCMYFVSWGSVAVYADSVKEVLHVREGEHFGEFSLLARNEKQTINAVAIEDSELYVLSRANFLQAVVSHPQLLERFPKVKKSRRRRLGTVRRNEVRL